MKKTVREWMQTEICSQRTINRILFIVVALFFVGCVWMFLQKYWLNPWERQALVEVMHRAEVIRHSSNEDLDKEFASSKSSEELAERRAWTNRDEVWESLTSSEIHWARICRSYETKPPLKPEDQKQYDEMGKRICATYDMQVKDSKAALNTRLGF